MVYYFNTQIVGWMKTIKYASWKGKPEIYDAVKEKDKQNCSNKFCVPGTSVYLTHNNNCIINLGKGTIIREHTLAFEPVVMTFVICCITCHHVLICLYLQKQFVFHFLDTVSRM